MPGFTGPSSNGAIHRCPVPVEPKFANRFYEPIILLKSLNRACESSQAPKTPDLLPDNTQSPEYAFHCFRGCGNTVTAFAVLSFPDRIEYRFASNQREEIDLIGARKFISYLIATLGKTEAHDLERITSHLLQTSLSFTRPRVTAYLHSLNKQSTSCIDTCTGEITKESHSILKKLEELQKLVVSASDSSLNDDAFSQQCEVVISAIDRLYQSDVDELIRSRATNGRITGSTCWCELRHAAGRLLSYLQAIKVLVLTRKRWPELFEDFEVKFITSSVPGKCPLRRQKRLESLSMCDVIGRMTSDPSKMENYKSHAQELEKFQLNATLRREATSKSFRPIVHAEVLLLESIEKDGGTHPSRFFNQYAYIGCSKPTCRLCDYYFQSHSSGVQVRPTHRNIYPSWRLPDVYEDEGLKSQKKRTDLMNKILVRVREDAFRTLTEKVPEIKRHDSNTEPTYLIDNIPGVYEGKELLEIEFEGLAIENLEAHNSSATISPDKDEELAASESEDEGDGGGAKLQ
ncbi:hypothetical protein B0O99DRAFT_725644 [Bisporella sp. PMI_857]|nr:hypothetical protein B0O99DRAFT_725644 [Bisporella sp. PMI_857]